MSSPSLSRRAVLGAAASAPLLAGCDRALSFIAELMGDELPEAFGAPEGASIDPVVHMLNRVSFGPRPGDLDRARAMGIDRYVEWQLDGEAIDDRACEVRTSVIDAAHAPTPLLFELPPDQVETQIGRHALLRAVYSQRQLHEVMVELWSDHFHVGIGKASCRHLYPAYDREVCRRHALGSFGDLLTASAKHPAMLVYLDGRDNRRAGSSPADGARQGPNENYARELFELHTLGVHGGYTQRDVMEAARCLTGFVVREEWRPGAVEFVPELHDSGEKLVLGETIAAGGGADDVDKLLRIVGSHPSTARHVTGKIARAFVADDPPAALVERASATFLSSHGDIKKTVAAILTDPDFSTGAGAKIKRPFRFVASALRALHADTHAKGPLLGWLSRMGHAPFAWPTPDGYPMKSEPWLTTTLTRFQLAFDLAGDGVEGTRVDLDRLAGACRHSQPRLGLAAHLFGRAPSERERAELLACSSLSDAVALALAGPAFQRY